MSESWIVDDFEAGLKQFEAALNRMSHIYRA